MTLLLSPSGMLLALLCVFISSIANGANDFSLNSLILDEIGSKTSLNSLSSGFDERVGVSEDLLRELLDRVLSQQTITGSPEFRLPFHWEKIRGLFGSEIRFNLHDNPLLTLIRHKFGIFDNNFFVTAWIVSQLVEVTKYGQMNFVPEESLKLALEGLQIFYDKNRENGSNLAVFWPQENFNESQQLWGATCQNLDGMIELFNKSVPWNFAEGLLRFFGARNLAKNLELIRSVITSFVKIFAVPADFDDSFINVGLGSLLKTSNFSNAYKTWLSSNDKPENLFKALKTYAYRPFGSNNETNMVDTRTYYYARFFLQQAAAEGKPLALVSTWAQNLTEIRKQRPTISTPLSVNNVDCTVAANAIYGLTVAALDHNQNSSWFDEDISMIYRNTSDFIAWAIENDVVQQRPDLALTYYPSIFNFFWFVSRTVFHLESYFNVSSLATDIARELTATRKVFNEVKLVATNFLLSRAVSESAREIYFDDFLGNNDKSFFGKTESHGDSRIATTAMTINALIGFHCYFSETKLKIIWNNDASFTVRETVTKAVRWLQNQIISSRLRKMNVFFSGSVKGYTSMPGMYPFNYLKYLNGSSPYAPVSPTASYDIVIAIQGVVGETEYQKMIEQTEKMLAKMGREFPFNFPGFNAPGSVFPFWSSEAFTYSSALLALSQYRNIEI